VEYDEDLRAKVRAREDLAELQRQTDDYYSSVQKGNADAYNAVQAMKAQNEATRAMIDAVRQGQDAVDALTIKQAGDNAVANLAVGVSDELAAATRRRAEEAARLGIELADWPTRSSTWASCPPA
jgi:hypothetical protein